MKRVLFALLLATASGILPLAHSQSVPTLVNYQGQIQNPDGTAPPIADYTLTFRIYDAAQGGTLIWGPQIFDGQAGLGYGPKIPVVQGYFNVTLGAMDTNNRPLSAAFSGAVRYIEITVSNRPPIQPRQQLLSAPFAFNAAQLNGFGWDAVFANGNPSTGTINGSRITSESVTSAQIANNSITAADIAPSTITGSQIQDRSITSSDIALGTITGSEIADRSITRSDIAIETISGSEVLDRSITGNDIEYYSITGYEIDYATITGYNIESGSVPASDLSGGTIAGTFFATEGTLASFNTAGGGGYVGTQGSAGGVRVAITSTSGASDNGYVSVRSASGENRAALYVQANGRGAVVRDDEYVPSDLRLKEDIQALSGSLDTIKAIRGVSYLRKDVANSKREVGVIAQEVEKVIPEAVHRLTEADNAEAPASQAKGIAGTADPKSAFRDILCVDYSRLIPVLIEAVKEQQAQIQSLAQRVKELEAKR